MVISFESPLNRTRNSKMFLRNIIQELAGINYCKWNLTTHGYKVNNVLYFQGQNSQLPPIALPFYSFIKFNMKSKIYCSKCSLITDTNIIPKGWEE